MARIAEAEIERLKAEVSVVTLVERRGIQLKRVGSNLVGLCPFHNDKNTPNLVVTPDKNVWHCFVCQVGGSVIDWVKKVEGASFRHAVELLRGGANLASTTRESTPMPKHHMRRKLEPLASREASETELLGRVVAHYQASLQSNPEGLAYLKERGLDNAEMVEQFRLGFSNRTLGYRLPHSQTQLGRELRQKLEELGVYRATGHEAMRGCVVVPLFDEEGRAVQLYGRRIERAERGAVPHLYLAGGHRGVFNRAGIQGCEEVILCEAVIDALTFWCAGYRNVTTAYGVEGVTEEIIAALVQANVKRVKIAFDRDEAGDRGAERVAAKLEGLGIETYRVVFPRGMDANEYARKVGPAGKSLGLVLRHAEWMGRGKPPVALMVVEEPPAPEPIAPLEAEPIAPALQEQPDQEAPTEPEQAAEERSEVQAAEDTAPPTEAEATPAPLVNLREALRARKQEPQRQAQDIPLLVANPEGKEVEAKQEPAPTPTITTAANAPPPMPVASSSVASAVAKDGEDLTLTFRDSGRKWRVRPWGKSAQGELKVNLLISRETKEDGFFVDNVDLYAARQRAAFAKQAADELRAPEDALRRELGVIVLEVEKARQESQAAAALEEAKKAPEAMSEEERAEALELLNDPKLLERVLEDLARAGVVGEENNKLVAYLATTSRKLDEPLAVVIQSSSAAGKSSLMDAVLALMPDEERVQYSAMTGQSLFYMSGQDLKHKILAIVEEEGAERASYALKLLQSEGELTIASTGKDPTTGRHVTQTYRVEGPVMIFLTTTASDVDEELLNRCLVLAVDEGRGQTQAIHERQRRAQTLAGRIEREERLRVRRLHKNAQRLLRPMVVVNPFAMDLRFPDHATRTRRDHMKYLTLINAVTLLHQYQRPVKTTVHRERRLEYIEATKEDIEIATRLARAVLGRSLDELPPQTRRLLELLTAMVAEQVKREGINQTDVRFTRRQIREWTRWGQTQLKLHLDRLEEHEYVVAHRFGRSTRLHQYELLISEEGLQGGDSAAGLMAGMQYDPTSSGVRGTSSGGHRGNIGPLSPHYRAGSDEELRRKKASGVASALNGANRSTPEAAARTVAASS